MTDLRNLKRRAERARKFPENTCAASRHVHMIALQLTIGGHSPMIEDDPRYCGESMLAVCAALWEARDKLKKIEP
jgi:hypothetical protein